ncbi:MAG: GNAT family N-acetyltransferase [Gemmatimonadaceae bacterium]
MDRLTASSGSPSGDLLALWTAADGGETSAVGPWVSTPASISSLRRVVITERETGLAVCEAGMLRAHVRRVGMRLTIAPVTFNPVGEPNGASRGDVLTHLLEAAAGEASFPVPWMLLSLYVAVENDDLVDAAWRWCVRQGAHCEIDPGAGTWTRVTMIKPGLRGLFLLAREKLGRGATRSRLIGAYHSRLGSMAAGRTARGSVSVLLATPVAALEADQSGDPELVAPPGLSFRWATDAEVARRPRFYATSAVDAPRRMERGDRCVVGEMGGEIVFHRWLSEDPRLLAGVRMRAGGPPGRLIYAYDDRTAPGYRGRGIAPLAFQWVAPFYRGHECVMLASVDRTNRSSLRAYARAGFRNVAITGSSDRDRSHAAPEQAAFARRLDAEEAIAYLREAPCSGAGIWVTATGASMSPAITDGSRVLLAPARDSVRIGTVVLAPIAGRLVLHRVISCDGDRIVTQGDACLTADFPIMRSQVLGRGLAVTSGGNMVALVPTLRFGVRALAGHGRARARLLLARGWRRSRTVVRSFLRRSAAGGSCRSVP